MEPTVDQIKQAHIEQRAISTRSGVTLGAIFIGLQTFLIIAQLYLGAQRDTAQGYKTDLADLLRRLDGQHQTLVTRVDAIEQHGTVYSNREIASLNEALKVEATSRGGADQANERVHEDIFRRLEAVDAHINRITGTWLPSIEERLANARENVAKFAGLNECVGPKAAH